MSLTEDACTYSLRTHMHPHDRKGREGKGIGGEGRTSVFQLTRLRRSARRLEALRAEVVA